MSAADAAAVLSGKELAASIRTETASRAAARAGALTPVPGGVGPVTTALLLQHTVRAAAGAV
jgi:5,10-methylene-tetrahydrofolate dehydrogenase/methenyl tetrahydrofolate cyclohydrolase